MTDIADIKARLDIVEVVGGYVELRQAGKNFTAPCPFHAERTPSFFVFSDSQTWRCFGACAAGGDVLNFVQKAEGLDFSGTLRFVAKQLGIELSKPQGSSQPNHTLPLFSANDAAMKFYINQLHAPQGHNALVYLHGRGLSQKTIDEFHLGYSPEETGVLVNHLMKTGFPHDILVAAGLINSSSDGSREVFRNRIMFPITDIQGRVVGFGGRQLNNNGPKYMNSPRTEVFDKSRTLYGLEQAAPTIRANGTAILVEGYIDAITAHQVGSTNVIASMGTAITQPQLDSLINIASTIIFALDADSAGQNATLQKLSEALTSFQKLQTKSMVRSTKNSTIFATPKKQMDFRVLSLPEGFDPDTLIREDLKHWQDLVSEAQPLLDRLFKEISSQTNIHSSTDKVALTEKLMPLIYSSVDNFIDQDHYFQLLAQILGVSRSTLQASVGHQQSQIRATRTKNQDSSFVASSNAFTAAESNFTENYCLGLILKYPELKDMATHYALNELFSSENQALFTVYEENGTIERLRDVVQGTPLEPHLQKLISIKIPPLELAERTQALKQTLRTLQEKRLREMKRQESEISAEGIYNNHESGHSFDQSALNTNEELRRLFNDKDRRP
jgi:DNA primase